MASKKTGPLPLIGQDGKVAQTMEDATDMIARRWTRLWEVQEKRGARETVLGSFHVRKICFPLPSPRSSRSPSRASPTSWKRHLGDYYSHLKATWVSALLQSASLIINTGVSPCEDAASAVEDEERGEETRHCSGGVSSNNTTALQPAWTSAIMFYRSGTIHKQQTIWPPLTPPQPVSLKTVEPSRQASCCSPEELLLAGCSQFQ